MKLQELKRMNSSTKKIYGIFYAPTKENAENATEIENMSSEYGIEEGSPCYTKSGDYGIYDNGWNWVDKN